MLVKVVRSSNRAVWVQLSANRTVSAVFGHLTVALDSPGGVPRVSDKPVLKAALDSITNNGNDVISRVTITVSIQNTAIVVVKAIITLFTFDGNRKHTLLKSRVHLARVGISNRIIVTKGKS